MTEAMQVIVAQLLLAMLSAMSISIADPSGRGV
jgi:hypothetical protein